jgi:hypothetical protein
MIDYTDQPRTDDAGDDFDLPLDAVRYRAGYVRIDSGHLALVDPMHADHLDDADLTAEPSQMGHAVITPTGLGDGFYPVYIENAVLDDAERSRVTRVIVDCTPTAEQTDYLIREQERANAEKLHDVSDPVSAFGLLTVLHAEAPPWAGDPDDDDRLVVPQVELDRIAERWQISAKQMRSLADALVDAGFVRVYGAEAAWRSGARWQS